MVTNFNYCTRKKLAVIWSMLWTQISKKDKEANLNSGRRAHNQAKYSGTETASDRKQF